MSIGGTFRQTSVSTQTCHKRRPVWKKVFCTFTCCGRRTHGDDDNGLVADECTFTNIQPIQRRLPYLGPIQDTSHMTASREMKIPSSHPLSFLREVEGTRATPSKKSSSILDENQSTENAFLRKPSSLNTTRRVEPKLHHIQAPIRDTHHLNQYHYDETLVPAKNSVSPNITAALHHTMSNQSLSVGGLSEIHNSLCSDSFVQTRYVSRRCGEDEVTSNVNIISCKETALPVLTTSLNCHSSDVTIHRHTSQPVQCQDIVLPLRSATISQSLSPNVGDIQTSVPYHRAQAHCKRDIHPGFQSIQKTDIISSCTSLSPSSHWSRVMPTYQSCRGVSIAEFNRGTFSNNLKNTKNGYLMFSRDILINQSLPSALSVIDNKEGIPTTPLNTKTTVSCQMLSVTIPSSEDRSTGFQSAPTTVYFAKFSISSRQNCTSLIVGSMTREGINRWSHSAPDSLSSRRPLPASMCIVKPAPMASSKSLAVPIDVPAIKVASLRRDIRGHTWVDDAPDCVFHFTDASTFCESVKTNSPIRPPLFHPVVVKTVVSQGIDGGSEQVSGLLSCEADNLRYADELLHQHQFSKELQHSSEIYMVHTKSVGTNHSLDVISSDVGWELTRSRTPQSHLQRNHPTPWKNATRSNTTPTAQGCNPKQPMIPPPAVETTNGSNGRNETTTQKPVIADSHNAQLPIMIQPVMPAWNCGTNWWDSNLFYHCGSNNANVMQPCIQPPQLQRQPMTPVKCNQKLQITSKRSSTGLGQNNNASLHQPLPQYNLFQNDTAGLWNIQDHAMQSSPSKTLRPSDYNLPSTCNVIPKTDLEDVCDKVSKPTILGRGCFGEVRLMKQLSSGMLCAVKVHHKDRDDKRIIKDLHREVSMLTSLDKLDCVPKLLGISRIGKDTDLPVLVQEFVGDPTTFKCTTVKDVIISKGLNGPSSFSVAIQLCRAMRDIHFIGLLHCDLKADNIMFMKGSSGEDGDVRIKIIDFGKAVSRTDKPKYEYFPKDKHADILKESGQIAPEVVRGLMPYSLYTEVYSIGKVLGKIDVSPGKFLTKLGKKCLAEDWNERPIIHELIHDIDSYIKGRQASYSRWARVG